MPSITMTDCPDCGCGEQECAEVGITCGCCGNFQFVPGDPAVIQQKFYNWELSCVFCGMTWQGHSIDTSYCSDPWLSGTTYHALGPGTYYRYIGPYSKWYMEEYLEEAIRKRTMGAIFDNCGNQIDISQNQ